MSPGPFIATTAVTSSGVCCYMKMPDGSVLAEYNTITDAQVKTAQNKDDTVVMQEIKPWYRSTNISCKCDTDSNLAAYSWDTKVALFHINNKRLCYWIHEPFNSKASCTDASRIQVPDPSDSSMQPRAGTRLAVTGDSAAKNITVFYEDKGGYLCCRLAQSLEWSDPVRLGSPAAGTGIAVISDDDNTEIRVFYQDDSFVIKDSYSSGDINTWTPGDAAFSEPTGLTDISAVQWVSDKTGQPEIRVYFQVGEYSIQEKCWTSEGDKGWYGDLVVFNAFIAPFAVLAFCRGNATSPVVSVWIASKDGRVLLQKAFNHADGWMGAIGCALPRTDYTA